MKIENVCTLHMSYVIYVYFVFVLYVFFIICVHIIVKNTYIMKNTSFIYEFSAFTSFRQVQLKLERVIQNLTKKAINLNLQLGIQTKR